MNFLPKLGRISQHWLFKFGLATSIVLLLLWLFCLPRPLFNRPLATILLDRNGDLLGASIASDEQWRIPAGDSISTKLLKAVIAFEDQRFYQHWGIDPQAIARAIRQNSAAGKVVSGGSTISMQVIRMAQDNPPRTWWQKVKEAFLATRLEWRYGKNDILRFWCNNAPFGGNIVGVEAAAWRYYGRSAEDLSWGEAATLAVLPNSPALIHPGRSRDQLLAKRNRLLKKLFERGDIDEVDYDLSLTEPLPDAPYPLPRRAPHLLQRLKAEHGLGRHRSTIQGDLQDRISGSVNRHQRTVATNGIHNAAAIVVEVATGDVVAYVGNSGRDPKHGPAVDMVQASRSPGSLLKPILYGLSMSKGTIGPKTLLADYPCSFQGFRPANFSNNFSGAVATDEALSRSLNIPFVHLLKQYGVPEFHEKLHDYGFRQITQPPGHYGLSLVLGGCEIKMEEIGSWFTGLARQQRYFYERQGRYASQLDWQPLNYRLADSKKLQQQRAAHVPERYPDLIDAGAGYHVLQALTQLNRPSETGQWQRFQSSREVAWKTGTSFGFRDAWAVGATPEYVVAVWVGNADGEGREGLVGVRAAAPLLFDIFNQLPRVATNWFEPPYDALAQLPICKESGMLAGPNCDGELVFVPKQAEFSNSCPYHIQLHLSEDRQYQVHRNCYDGQIIPSSWFELPPRMEHFYRRDHPDYHAVPTWIEGCDAIEQGNPMALISPYNNGKLSFSKDRSGRLIPAIFKAAHRYPETKIHWHLDGRFLGSTSELHSFEIIAETGAHSLILVDENGQQLQFNFRVAE